MMCTGSSLTSDVKSFKTTSGIAILGSVTEKQISITSPASSAIWPTGLQLCYYPIIVHPSENFALIRSAFVVTLGWNFDVLKFN